MHRKCGLLIIFLLFSWLDWHNLFFVCRCSHKGNSRCIHCTDVDPWDGGYLKENNIKHMSYHTYIRMLQSGVSKVRMLILISGLLVVADSLCSPLMFCVLSFIFFLLNCGYGTYFSCLISLWTKFITCLYLLSKYVHKTGHCKVNIGQLLYCLHCRIDLVNTDWITNHICTATWQCFGSVVVLLYTLELFFILENKLYGYSDYSILFAVVPTPLDRVAIDCLLVTHNVFPVAPINSVRNGPEGVCRPWYFILCVGESPPLLAIGPKYSEAVRISSFVPTLLLPIFILLLAFFY